MLRGEARARLHEARVALRDRDREARRHERALARARARRARRRTGRGPRRPRRRAPGSDGVVAQPPDRQLDQARLPLRGLGDQVRRVAPELAARQARDDEHAVRRVLALLDRRAERVELRQRAAVLVRHEQPHRLPAAREAARRSAPSAPRAPRPSTAETCGASGKRLSSRRRPISSTRSILFSTSCTGSSSAPISCEHLLDRGDHARRARPRRAEASATCSTMSATSVSSSVAAKPSTS